MNPIQITRTMRGTEFHVISLILVLLTGIFCLSVNAYMQTVYTIPSSGTISFMTARSGSPEDIQTAVDAVASLGGGIVYIPEGNFTFNYDGNYGVIIPGGVNIFGMGINKTILQVTEDYPTGQKNMFLADGGAGSKPIRISGISFKGLIVGDDSTYDTSGVRMTKSADFRIDHCHFQDFASGIETRNDIGYTLRGVIDHCSFDNPYKDDPSVPGEKKWGYGIIVGGDSSTWNEIDYYLGQYNGKNNIVYIEDCDFNRCRHCVASSGSRAWYVVRHCDFTDPRKYGMIDVHGSYAGGRGLEAYDNIIDSNNNSQSNPFWIRGGGGVIFNNTMKNQPNPAIVLTTEGTGIQAVQDLWIWDNTLINVGEGLLDPDGFTENVDYFLHEKADYIPYPYPHPLTFWE
jgi:hypothetical protein